MRLGHAVIISPAGGLDGFEALCGTPELELVANPEESPRRVEGQHSGGIPACVRGTPAELKIAAADGVSPPQEIRGEQRQNHCGDQQGNRKQNACAPHRAASTNVSQRSRADQSAFAPSATISEIGNLADGVVAGGAG
jgi:hypothetical protein